MEVFKRGFKMSGGHYDYKYFRISDLVDDIKNDYNSGLVIDYIKDATTTDKTIIMNEVNSLIRDLDRCAKRARALEYFMSGDYGPESYIENLNENSDDNS